MRKMDLPSNLGPEMSLGAGSHPACYQEEYWVPYFPRWVSGDLGLLETLRYPWEYEERVLGPLPILPDGGLGISFRKPLLDNEKGALWSGSGSAAAA